MFKITDLQNNLNIVTDYTFLTGSLSVPLAHIDRYVYILIHTDLHALYHFHKIEHVTFKYIEDTKWVLHIATLTEATRMLSSKLS